MRAIERRASSVAVACLLLVACGGPSTPGSGGPPPPGAPSPGPGPVPPGRESRTVGPEGAELALFGERLRLRVPAGALAEATEIVVEALPDEGDPWGGGGARYAFAPAGLTFATPATLELEPAPGLAAEHQAVWRRAGPGEPWEELASALDGGVLRAEITGFSAYRARARAPRVALHLSFVGENQRVATTLHTFSPYDGGDRRVLVDEVHEAEALEGTGEMTRPWTEADACGFRTSTPVLSMGSHVLAREVASSGTAEWSIGPAPADPYGASAREIALRIGARAAPEVRADIPVAGTGVRDVDMAVAFALLDDVRLDVRNPAGVPYDLRVRARALGDIAWGIGIPYVRAVASYRLLTCAGERSGPVLEVDEAVALRDADVDVAEQTVLGDLRAPRAQVVLDLVVQAGASATVCNSDGLGCPVDARSSSSVLGEIAVAVGPPGSFDP